MTEADPPSGPVTALLAAYAAGESEALDRLFPLVYEELRRIARRHLGDERTGHTLGATGLVHEAYLRLVDRTGVGDLRSRAHFYRLASRAMRRVLVDHARRYRTLKRGGGERPTALDEELVAAPARADTLLALDEALDRLDALDGRLAQVVECRFFGGLTEEETAATLDVTARTVRRDWIKARGWLARELGA